MKKFLLGSIAAMLLACFSTSFQSCNEDTKKWIENLGSLFSQYFGNDTTSQYYKILGNDSISNKENFLADMIEKYIAAKTCDSTEFMAGVWTYQSGSGDSIEIDTFWFYRDSTVLEHFISTADSIDVQYSGGYLYYKSFKQAIVQFNSVFNYNTGRNIDGYTEYHIFEVSNPAWMQALGVNQLTMNDLDTETGELLSSCTYTYVEDVKDEQ